MALGIILPALAVGAFAILLYAMIADLAPALGLLIFFGSSVAVCAGMSAIAAARRPMRPIEGEGRGCQGLKRRALRPGRKAGFRA